MAIPRRESELVTWAQNLSTRLNVSPLVFGVPVATAALLETRTDAFVAAYELAANDATKTRGVVAAKNDAKRLMRQTITDVCRLVEGTATVTDQQKYDLGVTVPVQPSSIPVPANAPGMEVLKVEGRRVFVRFFDTTNPSVRRKPAGVAGVALFSHTGGEVAPTDPGAYKFEGQTTRMTAIVEFPSEVTPGTRVHLTGFFFNPRGMSGPACQPISTNIEFGGPALPGDAETA
jgi:hypothetical protein